MTAVELKGNRCQCPACGEYFSRPRAFDRHRVGDHAKLDEWQGVRRCLTEAEMQARGMQRNAAGMWIVDCRHAAALAAHAAAGTAAATPLPARHWTALARDNAAPSTSISGGATT